MNRQKIEELIELVEKSDIAELEVHFFGGRKIVIRKNTPGGNDTYLMNAPPTHVQPNAPIPQPIPVPTHQETEKSATSTEQSETDNTSKFTEIKAPMVGTFYRKPSPDSPPYVNIGEHITVGQVICLIEAMKLFNEVKSEVSGTIKNILLEDASPVEFGQIIFLVELD
ncbi:acetyl-CoA carboxylase biotin carboxyl carrier protein [bacterium]|nr:acetyl-CoA carboxylase biotin carboxyl carrier protein [bacterium]